MLRIVRNLAMAGIKWQLFFSHAVLECEVEDQLAGFRGFAGRCRQDTNVMLLKSKTL